MTANMRREADGLPWRWEEEGTFWVFVWPELVPWPHRISWLFAPGKGDSQRKWVGDLWGVDEEGHLLIVESKLISGESPFECFVKDSRGNVNYHGVPPYNDLFDYWQNDRLLKEKQFRQAHPDALGPKQSETWPGVAPYSSKRTACRRWRHLYLRLFVPEIDSERYEERALNYLQLYRAKKSPPHYFGLYTLFGDEIVPEHPACYQELVNHIGPSRLHTFAVRRSPECYDPDECEISSYRVNAR